MMELFFILIFPVVVRWFDEWDEGGYRDGGSFGLMWMEREEGCCVD